MIFAPNFPPDAPARAQFHCKIFPVIDNTDIVPEK